MAFLKTAQMMMSCADSVGNYQLKLSLRIRKMWARGRTQEEETVCGMLRRGPSTSIQTVHGRELKADRNQTKRT